ncbi:MAG: hypothetical protein CLLPBCKN_003828 [Chroococcidiopsis cubana SAG 39.79]|nr:hypothetical protein [Chroococcidiopsis cubana]MDZ4874432.1 hypothetical protein [Chroococcidiopsis cubana SAG 39.79]
MTAQLLESQMHDERSQRLLPIVVTNAKRGAAFSQAGTLFLHEV